MIDEKTVRHVANIAKLELSDSEISSFSRQLNDVAENFKVLDELDTEGIEPSFHPIRTENALREDEIKECLNREKALELACHKEGEYFKAPKTM